MVLNLGFVFFWEQFFICIFFKYCFICISSFIITYLWTCNYCKP